MSLSRSRGLALLVAGTVAADWLTKLWVQNRLLLGEVRPVVEGWVFLAHRRNTGVAFSLFAGGDSPWRTALLTVGALVATGVCVRLMRSAPDGAVRLAAALVAAGALGNLGDRLLNGGVTDFILLRYFPYVFNVADVAVTAGALLLALRTVRGAELDAPPPQAA